MRTSKTFSMISYNTPQYLEFKLNELVKAKIIEEYRFIKHDGEDGDKDHIHLWIKPNRRIDTMELSEELTEIVPGETKPLKCIGARNSNEEDWLLYAIHDEDYLESHFSDNNGDGKKPYSIEDIYTNEPELLQRCYKVALDHKRGKWGNIKKELDNNRAPIDIITRYNINPTQLRSYLDLYSKYKAYETNKAIYDVDLETGELTEVHHNGEFYKN